MKPQRISEQFELMVRLGGQLGKSTKAAALLVLVEGPTDWAQLLQLADGLPLLVAADVPEVFAQLPADLKLGRIVLNMPESPIYDRLGQAMLQAVADELLKPGARVVAIYSGLEPGEIDSLSLLDLGEHLGRLTVRDLQQLQTSVPLETLQTVVNLALEIGREGREGKPVGTLFVVGDTRKVLAHSHSAGFDPVKGYSRKDRNLKNPRVREGIKEIAQMDGAIIVAPDGTVEAAARYIDASASEITLSKGLGARHWAAAAISRMTKAVAVAVSQSGGTVRIFQGGEVMLRIEPFRRAMKWKDFERENAD